MEEIKNSKRKFAISLAIFILLFIFCLVLNVGLPARAVNYPFIYTFGACVYLFYAVFVFYAFLLIFDKRWPRLKHPYYFLPIIFLLVGGSFLYTVIVNWENNLGNTSLFEVYNDAIANASGGYWTAKFVNLFESKLAGGIISFIPVKFMIDFMGQGGTLAIIIITILIGFALGILPWLISFIKKHKKEKEENKEIIEEEKAKKREEKERLKELKKQKKNEPPMRDVTFEESDIYEHASEIGADEVPSVIQNSETIVPNFENRSLETTTTSLFTKEISNPGVVSKAKFVMSSDKKDEVIEQSVTPSYPNENNIDAVPSFNKEEVKKTPIIDNREEHIEQINLDFDAKPELNEDLLKVEPEFVETKEVDSVSPIVTPVVSTVVNEVPIETETPVVEENKPERRKEPLIWNPPSTDLLTTYEISGDLEMNEQVANERKDLINIIFQDFKIAAKCTGFTIGPGITRFHIDYESNGLVKSVSNITEDISRRLSGASVRFEATVPGFSYSGLEVPNAKVTIVSFKEVIEALPDVNKHPMSVPFGKDITGKVIFADYNEFPHLLVSGTTGSGKSVFVNSIIATLIMRLSPDDFKLVLVDPKCVEMSKYQDIPHLICPIINDANQAKVMLDKLVVEMNERYKEFNAADFSTDLDSYNEYASEHNIPKKPRILAILDEYADLVDTCKEIGAPVQSLAQKARAAGIHLLIATQRPTTNIITGTIKANLSTRVSLSAASAVDSVTILDEGGAEKLMGHGDMLVKSPLLSRASLSRLQGCYIKTKEILHIINYLKENYKPDYWPDFMDLEDHSNDINEAIGTGHINMDNEMSDEEKYKAIVEWCSCQEFVSMSKIQRNFSVGFNKAGKIFNRLIAEGIVETNCENVSRGNRVLNRESRFNDAPSVSSDELER